MTSETKWPNACDNCNSRVSIEYVPPIGFLCAACREPAKLSEIHQEIARGFAEVGE